MGATGKLKKQVRGKKKPQPKESTTGLAAQMSDAETSGKIDPQKQEQVDDTIAMFLMLIHGRETRDATMEMLKAFPTGEESVPEAAFNMITTVEKRASGTTIPNDVKVAAMSYIIPDLLLLGNVAKIWEHPVPEESIKDVMQAAFQKYIEKGLKDKTLDPMQLQKEAESLMTPEQKRLALSYGEGAVPEQPTATMAANRYREEGVEQERAKFAKLQEENAQLKQAMAASQQQQPPPEALAGPGGAA